ncbi:MAG TPA: type II toxin-antitoxin system PemK/MazF family toxin [Bryobacteraceae bacterium]|nr:type II toxin-antitoxin system PemK/MazF family toxin [Bryobacteraceae bacterium]
MATHRGRSKSEAWPRRGEIYLTALDPAIGREIRKTRPALVVQNDVGNEFGSTTIVAPITSTVRMPISPVHVLLSASAQTGLSSTSVALLNQVRTVDRRRLVKRLGSAEAATMNLVDEAISISFGLPL